MQNLKVYKCFISSPGDCQEERQSCEEILKKMNDELANHMGISFETFMWEKDVLPDVGKNGQEIIDEYIKKSNYDIFIGIMKNRFGTPTNKAGSGTEHEFNDALLRKENSSDSIPKILFFFGKELVDPDYFNPEQYNKVKEFKESVQKKGLYIDFDKEKPFKEQLEEKMNIFLKELTPLSNPDEEIKKVDSIFKKLKDDLDNSLIAYNEKSPIWIEPIISSKREIPSNPTKNKNYKIEISSIIDSPNNFIIKAPSEFGLTTLAHYIKLKAWEKGKRFIYIDAHKTKKHKVVKDIKNEIEGFFYTTENHIDCILLDSICFEEQGAMKMVKNICEAYPDIPILIFNTMDNNFFLKSDEDDRVEIKRTFTSYYLLPLSQNEIRKIVTKYTINNSLEEDSEIILAKVTKDLETVNMHRTAKNCISILKASSKIGSEYNPVNRTKLLETLLGTIFLNYDLPTYHDKKPDLKDCSFVLGYLAEILVERKNFQFTDDFFKKELKAFCEENYIDLDLNYLLSILKDNSIIGIDSLGINYFKNSYWVFYFIAQRMNMNSDFRDSIYENKQYIDYPAIIEFYTGIDRNKEDALLVLKKDFDETLNIVRDKLNIPDKLNPYEKIKWTPDVKALEEEDKKISENVISSGLPDEVKDRYADKQYNQIRPYNQVINSVMREYSFLVLMRQISATSRALRNSDFVNKPDLKRELLERITQGWGEINKLLIVLSPLLADRGNIAFEGANFYLDDEDFNISNSEEKRLAVLTAVPTNVVKFFKDDLFSLKMGPLLIDKAIKETNSLIKHELMILIASERPKGWIKIIDKYIVNLDKNSYFLSDIKYVLNYNINYKNTEPEALAALKMLDKKCLAKHIYNSKNPDMGLIKKIK